MIDWTDPKSKISQYFTVKDACYLPSWKIYHTPTAREQASILKTAKLMDQVRALIGKPITVHCWIRPIKVNSSAQPELKPITSPSKTRLAAELNYNAFVGGSPSSAHTLGIAVDFSCSEDCDKTRLTLLPKLEVLGARMEALPGSSWVHLDWKPLPKGGERFFKP